MNRKLVRCAVLFSVTVVLSVPVYASGGGHHHRGWLNAPGYGPYPGQAWGPGYYAPPVVPVVPAPGYYPNLGYYGVRPGFAPGYGYHPHHHHHRPAFIGGRFGFPLPIGPAVQPGFHIYGGADFD